MRQERNDSSCPTVDDIRALLGIGAERAAKGQALAQTFVRVSGFEDAAEDSIVFATDESALRKALSSGAGLILGLTSGGGDVDDSRVLLVDNPRLAFSRIYQRWFAREGRFGVHPSAVIEVGAAIGDGSWVDAGAVVEGGATVGAECRIGPRVVIHKGTTLGDRVKVQAGAVLGSSGFGFAREASGYIGFPQIGKLVIEDDVEIGANCTIDRGALGETRIGRGTKIDNLVHVAHNCRIGADVIIAAQVGMAGSTVIEDGAMLGGQVGLGERVTIGQGVILGGQAGLLPGKRLDGDGKVFWGTPARPVREYLRDLVRMRRG